MFMKIKFQKKFVNENAMSFFSIKILLPIGNI